MNKWILVFLLLLCSCKSTKYIEVPVEVEKVRIEYVDKFQKDSIDTRDSIYVADSVFIYVKGDTVTQVQKSYIYKDKIIYKDKLVTDTVCKIDSIPYIKTVEKIVEVNVIKSWQRNLMWIGGIVCLCILGVLFWKLFKFIKIRK